MKECQRVYSTNKDEGMWGHFWTALADGGLS